MADTKISDLTANTAPVYDDLLVLVDNGTSTTQKITLANLFKEVSGQLAVDGVSGQGMAVTDSTGVITGGHTIGGGAGLPTTPDFESSEQTVATDTLLTIAHSLSEIPGLVHVVLRCKTADAGYDVNDEISWGTTGHSSADQGHCIVADDTNIEIIQAATIIATDKSTFNTTGLTTTRFKWVVKCWKTT